MSMGMALESKTILLERNRKIQELAEKIGSSGNTLGNKLLQDTLSEEDSLAIAEAEAEYESSGQLHDARTTLAALRRKHFG